MSNAANIAVPALCTLKMLLTLTQFRAICISLLWCSCVLCFSRVPSALWHQVWHHHHHHHHYIFIPHLVPWTVAATTFLTSCFLYNFFFQIVTCGGVHLSNSDLEFIFFKLYLNNLMYFMTLYNFVDII